MLLAYLSSVCLSVQVSTSNNRQGGGDDANKAWSLDLGLGEMLKTFVWVPLE